jgi:murein DD-endopeptidase MepM/ murein hydrolase activator NlpD
MRCPCEWLIFLALVPLGAPAQTDVGAVRLGAAVDEQRCTISRQSTVFDVQSAQIYVQFVARGVAAGDTLRIDWVTPAGAIHDAAVYENLPAAPALCFVSALPVTTAEGGHWRVRVSVNGTARVDKPFEIKAPPDDGSPRIVRLDYRAPLLDIAARRAGAETSVNVAVFKPGGGWEYIAHLLPDSSEAGRLRVELPALAPGRYIVLLRSPDGRMSAPAPLELASATGYHVPGVTGAAWRITQRPHGAFSHWGRSTYAWDLAPVENRLVAAMRAGVVTARDRGEGQNIRSRSFGNFISIDHGDGEYSHYAHLRTGTFLVRTGDRVEAGQPLAEVGNSGYSFGTHVHVHVTRAPQIAAQSIPFRFAELEIAAAGTTVVARNGYAAAAVGGRPPRWQAAVAFAGWWNETLTVPRGVKAIELRHGARTEGAGGFDLHAVAPSGQRYSLSAAEAEKGLRIDRPEAGGWRIWVQAVEGGAGELAFWVDAEIER